MNIQATMSGVKIVKVGAGTPPPPPPSTRKTTTGAARRKSTRTFPRGILKKGGTARAKVKPVRDPAKPPPVKAGRTLRILTEKGAENRRAKIRKTVRAMPDRVLREKLQKGGVNVSPKAPRPLVEDIATNAGMAGMVSLG
jgi:hypothetical protein